MKKGLSVNTDFCPLTLKKETALYNSGFFKALNLHRAVSFSQLYLF